MNTSGEMPEAPAFNLLDEAWLPVNWVKGGSGFVGLRELFVRSREITGLAEPSAPAFVALHRMLLAITHRALTAALGRWTDTDRARWYRDGLPIEAFERYFDTWRERFWLFHPTQPFMQVAALAHAAQTQVAKPWTRVSLVHVSGNNPVVFDHSVDLLPSANDPSEVLRAHLAYLQFVAGGLVKVFGEADKQGPLCNSACVIPVGRNLASTLLLALHPAVNDPDRALQDCPPWERPSPDVSQLQGNPSLASGVNDRYTRLTRSVLLVRDQSGCVSRVRFGEGLGLLEDEFAPDPMQSFRQGDGELIRLRFAEGRAAWRDLASLLPTPIGSRARPAAVLSWAQNLHDAVGEFDDAIQVVVAGTASKMGKDKMLETRIEHFRLPRGVLSDAATAAELRTQLKRAEDLHTAVKQLASRVAAMAAPNPNHKDARKRAGNVIDAGPLSSTFFAQAERGLWPLLQALGRGQVDDAHGLWSATLLRAAGAAWSAAGDLLGQSAAALRAKALNEGGFQALVWPLQPGTPSPTIAAREETSA
jgi:CRISPR system Cascade subunit CasA